MNYYKKFVSAVTAITCTASLTSNSMAQSANLSLQYEPGKHYYTTQSTNMLMDMGPGMQMNNLMVMSMKGSSKAHEKGVEVAINYEGMSMKVKMGENVVAQYDSAKEDNNAELAAQLDPMLDTKFSAIFSKDGKYIGAEGLDKLKLDPKTGITKETLESMMKQGSIMLPNREIKVGESWQAEIKVPMQGVGKMEMSFDEKLVSIAKMDGRDVARIEFTGKIKPLEMKQNGIVVKIDSKEITGTILFDLELHQARKTDMNMELIMEAGGRKMSMTAITTQELTKVEDAK